VTAWFIHGLIFWFAELITVIIGIPSSWDYSKFLSSGVSPADAVKSILINEKIVLALLVYLMTSLLFGIITAVITFLKFRKTDESKTDAFIVSVSLASVFYMFGGFWLNIKYLPNAALFISLIANITFLFTSIALAYVCFKILSTKKQFDVFRNFVALAFTMNLFMPGEMLLLRNYSFGLLNFKGITFSSILLTAGIFLFVIFKSILRLKLFENLSLVTVRNRVFFSVVVLALCSSLMIMKNHFVPHDRVKDKNNPNVLLIVMDTTRADHFSSYGYSRETTPYLDKIAGEGVIFKKAISPSGWTLPSHASMFTGLFPVEHGTGHVSPNLPLEIETMAEILTSEGYKTFGYSNNPWN